MSAFVYGIDMFTYCQIKGVHVCKGILILSSFAKHKPYLRHSLDLYQIYLYIYLFCFHIVQHHQALFCQGMHFGR